MLALLISQATAPTTQEVVRSAVDSEAGKLYAPLISALIVAGVGAVAGLGGLVIAWINAGKAAAAAVEAKAEAERAKYRAEVVAAEAKAQADAMHTAAAVCSDRLTTTNRKVDMMQDTLVKVALATPTLPPETPKPPTP